MDVHKPRERIFSILNDNTCASFTIKRTGSSPSSSSLAPVRPSICPIQARPKAPHLSKRNSSFSSASSPPFLRFDSSSSKSSSGSMDSSPSPLTPAYIYNDGSLSYDTHFRQDIGYLPSPSTTGITPYLEQQMMIGSIMPDPYQQQYPTKTVPILAPSSFPLLPPDEVQPIHPPSLASETSASTALSTTNPSPTTNTASSHPQPKKNKYPCPYATTHDCHATFTTSGHAARHGKKHTGEKGVHCPVCNKAFTRKDNMKQHERTHKAGSAPSVTTSKNSNSNSDDSTVRRSKAAITKEAQKAKAKKSDSFSTHTRGSSIINSPLSEVTSITPSVIDATNIPMTTLSVEPMLYPNPEIQVLAPQMLLPDQTSLSASVNSIYPPLSDETMMNANVLAMQQPLPPLDKQDVMQGLANVNLTVNGLPPLTMQQPVLARTFSDLDRLAQAAETYNSNFYGRQI